MESLISDCFHWLLKLGRSVMRNEAILFCKFSDIEQEYVHVSCSRHSWLHLPIARPCLGDRCRIAVFVLVVPHDVVMARSASTSF